MSIRPIKRIVEATPTREGAGVHLRRAFGFSDPTENDPFLLLDDFRNELPEHYRAGFPWHPHRGIETITYVLSGSVEHADSLGNRGVIGPGDVQWMTAGSGIIHQEMPEGNDTGQMHGFQLWANLPGSLKMTAPRYQEIASRDIPEVTDDDGTKARVIAGELFGATGPIDGVAAEPSYLDITLPPRTKKTLPIETHRHAFAYVFEGSGRFADASEPFAPQVEAEDDVIRRARPHEAGNRSLVIFDRGDSITVESGEEALRFLLVSGKPIEEPVAWYGPVVMNTQAELQQAFGELQDGTFLRHGKS